MTNLPSFTDALKQLIASPFISLTQAHWVQGNIELIQLLASWFESIGFAIDVQLVPRTSNKYNLLTKLGGGEGGLLLTGHSDSVPFDQQRWQFDPFKVIDKDNRFYGLGTCGIKGFFAFVLEVCRDIKAQQLAKHLYILATADEETTIAGTRFFAKQ